MRRRVLWAIALVGGALLVLALALQGPLTGGPTPAASGLAGRFPSPPPRRGATVWAVGDGATGSQAARTVADLIAADRPARFLYLGDVYENGSAADFRSNYATVYGRLRRITAPTPGNHDWAGHLGGYDRYWRSITGRRPPDHFGFRLAGWKVMSLNSEGPLRRQVNGHGTCRLAFWHRPRFSAGSHGDQRDVDPLWSAVRGRARLVLSGHDHNMQELRPRGGTTQLIAGSGGRGHYPLNPADRRLAWSNKRDYGALRLKLRPGRAAYAFVAADGRVLRKGAVRCRG
jgi:Calcineurin-like phosphoesterase